LKGKQTLLTTTEGTHDVIFSTNYFFDQYSSITTPNVAAIYDLAGKEKQRLLTGINKLADYKLGKTIVQTIPVNGIEEYARIIYPSDFDSTKKYPVLVYVYGGPHAQLITNSWYAGANLWMNWMAEQGYIIFTVDSRGSANRGFEFESVIHRELGTTEMKDQIAALEWLKKKSYIDGNRIAVHGWSFGGFMTTNLMLTYPNEFKVGVAGGPVTNWALYEVMYGERYMDRPEQNKEGYEKTDLSKKVNTLKGKLLLIHGTVDDVVVMQHNLRLVKAFVEAGKQMDFFPYPMHLHNVMGKDRVHLMTKVLNYILENNK
jgi:dipeptidyl-peptidase-4